MCRGAAQSMICRSARPTTPCLFFWSEVSSLERLPRFALRSAEAARLASRAASAPVGCETGEADRARPPDIVFLPPPPPLLLPPPTLPDGLLPPAFGAAAAAAPAAAAAAVLGSFGLATAVAEEVAKSQTCTSFPCPSGHNTSGTPSAPAVAASTSGRATDSYTSCCWMSLGRMPSKSNCSGVAAESTFGSRSPCNHNRCPLPSNCIVGSPSSIRGGLSDEHAPESPLLSFVLPPCPLLKTFGDVGRGDSTLDVAGEDSVAVIARGVCTDTWEGARRAMIER